MAKKHKSKFSIRKATPIEQKYESDLGGVAKIIDGLAKKVNPNNIDEINKLIEDLRKYSTEIQGWAKTKANNMLNAVNFQSKREWDEISGRMSIGLKNLLMNKRVKEELEKYLNDNVRLITSLPLDAAQRLHKSLQKNIYTGEKRASSIAEDLLKLGGITRSRANLIARTEVARVATGLIKVRAESIGVQWFSWRSTHDIRVRPSHKMMDRVLVRWDDPPSPEELAGEKRSYGKYLPGGSFNCRCFSVPLIKVDDVTWPAKVYTNGKIQRMSRDKFLELNNGVYRKAA